jgi:hypothetical protein
VTPRLEHGRCLADRFLGRVARQLGEFTVDSDDARLRVGDDHRLQAVLEDLRRQIGFRHVFLVFLPLLTQAARAEADADQADEPEAAMRCGTAREACARRVVELLETDGDADRRVEVADLDSPAGRGTSCTIPGCAPAA